MKNMVKRVLGKYLGFANCTTNKTEAEAKVRQAKIPVARVKTFDGACCKLGNNHPAVIAYRNIISHIDTSKSNSDIIAYLKLRIVCAALNDGWEPRFTEDEDRWFPWFTLWTEDELSEKSDEWKASRALISTEPYIGEWAGFTCALSDYAPANASTLVGSRLCLKSEALATYCGKQFINLWADFNLKRK